MKIAVACTGKGGPDDNVSPVFARCRTFSILEIDDGQITGIEIIKNESSDLPKNAGYISAQAISEKGVDIVIAGRFGPNATAVFRDNSVSQVALSDLTVHDAALKASSINEGQCYGILSGNINLRNSGGTAGNRTIMQEKNVNGPFVVPFICPKCSCTMPRKPTVTSMKCPNCGSDMN